MSCALAGQCVGLVVRAMVTSAVVHLAVQHCCSQTKATPRCSGRLSAFRWPTLLDKRAASRSDTPALMLRDRHLISMIALALGPAAIDSMIARLQRVRLFPVLAC